MTEFTEEKLAELRAVAEAATMPDCYVCGCTGLCGGVCPNPKPVYLSIDHETVLARIAALEAANVRETGECFTCGAQSVRKLDELEAALEAKTAEAQRIPLYAMLDVFHAVTGTSHPEWDRLYEKHGYAESWARVLAMVRDAVRERDEARAALDDLAADPGHKAAKYWKWWQRERARADRAEAALERVREARAGYPECDKYDDDSPVVCGWKRTVQSIDAALEAIEGAEQ